MRIDPKYFIPFIIIVAIFAALLITYYTISSQQERREAFQERIVTQDTLQTEKMPVLNARDSLSVSDFQGQYVVLDFWATWSNTTEESHSQLADVAEANKDKLSVLAAVVEDQKDKVSAYMQDHNFPFHFVHGSGVFNQYEVPGVPTQLVYDPEGELISIFYGYRNSMQYDSLRTLLSHE